MQQQYLLGLDLGDSVLGVMCTCVCVVKNRAHPTSQSNWRGDSSPVVCDIPAAQGVAKRDLCVLTSFLDTESPKPKRSEM